MATTILYPVDLPCPLLAGNRMTGGQTFKRSVFDHSIRQRKSYCADYGVSFSFTAQTSAQMSDFRSFYYNALGNGVKSFLSSWEIEGDTTQKEFRFSNVYSTTAIGAGVYSITANFEMITKIKEL